MNAVIYPLSLIALLMSGCADKKKPQVAHQAGVAAVEQANAAPKEPMTDSIAFNSRSLSGFAASDTTLMIGDSGGVLMIQDRQSGTRQYVETGMDSPVMVHVAGKLLAAGRWNARILVWDGRKQPAPVPEPVLDERLPDGRILHVCAHGAEALVAFSARSRAAGSHPLKDQVSLEPSRLFHYDDAGRIQEIGIHPLAGVVALMAFNAARIVVSLQNQPGLLYVLDRAQPAAPALAVPLQEPAVALGTDAAGTIHFATTTTIGRLNFLDREIQTERLFTLPPNFPSILQLAFRADGSIYGATSEGVWKWQQGGPPVQLTTDQAVGISAQHDLLLVLENGQGLFAIGEAKEWLVQW